MLAHLAAFGDPSSTLLLHQLARATLGKSDAIIYFIPLAQFAQGTSTAIRNYSEAAFTQVFASYDQDAGLLAARPSHSLASPAGGPRGANSDPAAKKPSSSKTSGEPTYGFTTSRWQTYLKLVPILTAKIALFKYRGQEAEAQKVLDESTLR